MRSRWHQSGGCPPERGKSIDPVTSVRLGPVILSIKSIIICHMNLMRIGCAVCLVLVLNACGTPRILLPESLAGQAEVPGGSTARMWGDELPNNIAERVEKFRQQFGSLDDKNVFLEPPTYLALSGVGSNGAFGAGLLKGWSESGTRPKIFIVAGVSTGALIDRLPFLAAIMTKVSNCFLPVFQLTT